MTNRSPGSGVGERAEASGAADAVRADPGVATRLPPVRRHPKVSGHLHPRASALHRPKANARPHPKGPMAAEMNLEDPAAADPKVLVVQAVHEAVARSARPLG